MEHYQPTLIWYASDTLARSSLKVFVYEDKGSFLLEDGGLRFIGNHCDFEIRNIQAVTLTTQTPNWPIHLVLAALFLYSLMTQGLMIFLALMPVVACVVLGLTVGLATKWVRVTFQTGEGGEKSVWFADGGNFGWAGIFGGTRQLCELIRRHTLDAQGSFTEGILLGPPVASPREPVPEECLWCEETVIPDEDRRCPACNRPM